MDNLQPQWSKTKISRLKSLNYFESLISALPLATADKNRLYDGLKKIETEQAAREIEIIQLREEKQKWDQQLINIQSALAAKQFEWSELEKAYQELEAFSDIVAHDLNGPIRTVSNFAQILHMQSGNLLSESAQESLQFIISGTNDMQMIVNDLLALSKAGKRNFDTEGVDLNLIMELVIYNLKLQIKAHNVRINIPNPLPVIQGNKSNLRQLFQNLIENSIKFRSSATPEVSILYSRLADNKWEFKVIDNGVGMTGSLEEIVLLPAQRLNKRKGSSNGIGLAICKKIVNAYQGDIRYERNIDGGTTFVFTIKDNNNISTILGPILTDVKSTRVDEQTA